MNLAFLFVLISAAYLLRKRLIFRRLVGNHRREFKALSNLQRDISKELSGLTQLAESGAPLDKTHLQRAQQIVKNIEHLLRQLDNFRKNQRPQSVRIFRVALTNAERELRAYLNTSQRLSRAIFQLTELEIATNSVIEISKPKACKTLRKTVL